MMQFLVEAVILTMTGGLLGFLGGAGLAHLLAPLYQMRLVVAAFIFTLIFRLMLSC